MNTPTVRPAAPAPLGPVFRGAGALGLAQATALGSGVVVQVIAARHLSPGDYGVFATVNLTGLFFLVLLTGGAPQALRRWVGVDPGQLAAAGRWLRRVHLPLCLAAGALLAVLARPVAWGIGDDSLVVPTALLGVEIFFRAGLLEPCLLLFNGLGQHALQGLLMAAYSVARVIGVASLLLTGGGPAAGVAGLALAAAVMALPATAAVRRQGGAGAAPVSTAAQGAEVLAWVKFASLYEVLSFVLVAANLWLVQLLTAERDEVGVYAACAMLARGALSVGLALAGGTFARLAAALTAQASDQARILIARVLAALALLLAPLVVLAFLHGAAALALVCGSAYGRCGLLPGALFAGTACMAAVAYLGEVLGAAARLRSRLAIMAVLTALSIPLTAAAVHAAGPRAGAWALLATGAVGLAALAWAVQRLIGPYLPWGALGRCAAAAALMALLLLGLGQPTTLAALGAHALAGAGVYGAGLILLGALVTKASARFGGLARGAGRPGKETPVTGVPS